MTKFLIVPALAALSMVAASQGLQRVQPESEKTEAARAAGSAQKIDLPGGWFNTPTEIKDTAQTVAWIAAALFFVYKAYAGYMFINLSIAVEARRRTSRSRQGRDDLVVRTTLTKGDRATLKLGLVEIVVEGAHPSHVAISEVQVSEKTRVRPLKLTPGETTHFETCFDVDSDSPYTIVVTVRGSRRGCWKASYVSLPDEPDLHSNAPSNTRLQPAAPVRS